MIRVYSYGNCSTCRNAVKWLREKGIVFEEKAIRETPPSVEELGEMVAGYGGKLTRVFNTSSQDYRDAGLKDRLLEISHEEAFALQQGNGNLVKRPFVLGEGVRLVGFRVEEWEEVFGRAGLLG